MEQPFLVFSTALLTLSMAFPSEAQTTTRLGRHEQTPFECGTRAPAEWLAEVREAVARGEVPDPRTRSIPPIPPGVEPESRGGPPTVGTDDLFPYPDASGLLLTDFSDASLVFLMIDAANALLAARGDSFDFVGFWVNFTPHHTLGLAFYQPIENDVLGIGDPSTIGTPVFEWRSALGLGGTRIEGWSTSTLGLGTMDNSLP